MGYPQDEFFVPHIDRLLLAAESNRHRIITDKIVRNVPSPDDAAKEEGGY